MAWLNSSSSSFWSSLPDEPFSASPEANLSVLCQNNLLQGTWVSDEVKPLLSHLNPDYALTPQLRVDGGELSSKSVEVDHILDMIAQLFHIRHICIP